MSAQPAAQNSLGDSQDGSDNAVASVRGRVSRRNEDSSSDRLDACQRALRACDHASDLSLNPSANSPAFIRCLTKVRKTARHSGVEYTLSELKKLASLARIGWIEDRRITHPWFGSAPVKDTAQLSFIKRALPGPPERTVQRAKSDHREHLSSVHTTPQRYLVKARQFAKSWAAKRLDTNPVDELSLTDSSCLEKTRKMGGQAEWVREALGGENAPPLECERPDTVSPELWERILAGRRLTTCCESVIPWDEYPKAQVEVVPEFGLKARIVTKSSAPDIILGHQVRRRLFRGLRKDPAVRDILAGDIKACLDRFIGSQGEVLSSDFTAASDLLPLDLISALVEGLNDSGKLTNIEYRILKRMTGPQVISYPDGTEITSSRGILMGLPSTWALLNLSHLFWWRMALEAPEKTHRLNTYSIFGDDSLAVVERCVRLAYEKSCRECGMEFSDGKHANSRRRGVYLERLIRFSGSKVRLCDGYPMKRNRKFILRTFPSVSTSKQAKALEALLPPINSYYAVQVSGWRIDDAIPLRGLVYPTSGSGDVLSRVAAGPLWRTLGAVVEGMKQEFCVPRIYAVQQSLWSSTARRLRSLGLPPIARSLGGSGLLAGPRDRSLERIVGPDHRKAIAVLITDTGKKKDPSFLLRPWQCADKAIPSWVMEESEQIVQGVRYQSRDPDRDLPEGAVELPDVVKDSMVFQLEGLSLIFRMEDASWGRTDLSKTIAKRRKALVNRWKSVQPFRGSVREAERRWKEVALTATHFHSGRYPVSDHWFPSGISPVVPAIATRARADALKGLSPFETRDLGGNVDRPRQAWDPP